MNLIIVSIFSILFLALALYRLDWAILLMIAALPTYLLRFKVAGLPSTALEVMILVSFTIWFLRSFLPRIKNIFKKNTERLNYPFSLEIILLIIIAFVAAGVAGFSSSALGIWKAYFFEPILVFILIFNVFKSKKDWTKILWALLISAAAVSLLAIFQKMTGLLIANPFWAQAGARRAVSFFGYPNAVGLYLGPLVMIFIGWLLSYNWKNVQEQLGQKTFIATTIIISLLAIYSARSEGALIGLVAGLIIFGLFAGRRERLATFILLIIVIGGTFVFSPSRDFIIQKLTFQDLSSQIRKQQWKETLIMLNHGHFGLGAGLSNYQNAVAPYHQPGLFFNSDNLPNFDAELRANATLRAKYWQPVEIYMYPHNIFLNFWSELGLAGALLFVWIIIKYLYLSLKMVVAYGRENKNEKYLALGLMAAMIVIIVHGLVDVPYLKNDLAVMFWLLLALVGEIGLDYRRGQELKN